MWTDAVMEPCLIEPIEDVGMGCAFPVTIIYFGTGDVAQQSSSIQISLYGVVLVSTQFLPNLLCIVFVLADKGLSLVSVQDFHKCDMANFFVPSAGLCLQLWWVCDWDQEHPQGLECQFGFQSHV